MDARIYTCGDCKNVMMMMFSGGCTPECCGKPMNVLDEQTADSSTEKHVPIITKTGTGYEVSVGSTLHPMLDKHWIQWIELDVDGIKMLKELKPGDEPKAQFSVGTTGKTVKAREYCNLHGLWKGEP